MPNLVHHFGVLSPGGNFGWELNHCAPNSTALLIVGGSAANAPFKGGTMVPHPDFIYWPGTWTGPGGVFGFGAVWPLSAPPGLTVYFQYWMQDAVAVQGWSASNALTTTSL